jgi:hypothetical protein
LFNKGRERVKGYYFKMDIDREEGPQLLHYFSLLVDESCQEDKTHAPFATPAALLMPTDFPPPLPLPLQPARKHKKKRLSSEAIEVYQTK